MSALEEFRSALAATILGIATVGPGWPGEALAGEDLSAERAEPEAKSPAADQDVSVGTAQPEVESSVDDLPNPPEIRTKGDVLRATFTVAPREVTVAGKTFTSNVINGQFVPPTLRVDRGSQTRIGILNQTGPADIALKQPSPTNIHYHGMDVSPLVPADNVFVRVRPGTDYRSVVNVPADHPEGLHWYHAHVHHFVERQLLSGYSA